MKRKMKKQKAQHRGGGRLGLRRRPPAAAACRRRRLGGGWAAAACGRRPPPNSETGTSTVPGRCPRRQIVPKFGMRTGVYIWARPRAKKRGLPASQTHALVNLPNARTTPSYYPR